MDRSRWPVFVTGTVCRGFGRGSRDLGVPTANLSQEVVDGLPDFLVPGVYMGWASVDGGRVDKMVMSLGWNPFYANEKKTMEVHLMDKYEEEFYGSTLRVVVLEYIREEKSFSSVDELVRAIRSDIATARQRLDTPQYLAYKDFKFFTGDT
ncbi:hypothetical protein AAG570_003790 [Ranatra chinensis]|uniref:riboflavin kinase n=1 Tax=Ranatra chinensis TaxID=642074 RepID=A0ABD0Y4R5_9HEMI